ncbi:hypothetical protein [Nocardia asiatica]|uniref:hypothetical protein n=1 Tax=Nocardia asiatica TaxID=209252 RepID=UPI0024548B20|nr:hypothetical protein [Nocardia asiatica]
MPEREKLDDFWRHSPGLQSCQFFGAFLVRCLACFAHFLFRSAGVGCCTLQAGGFGLLSDRPFSRVGDFPLRVLVECRECLRHPFSGVTFNLCALGFRRCTYLLGSRGFLSAPSVALSLLRSFRPPTRSVHSELLHPLELLGSLACPRSLGDDFPTVL